MADSKNKFWKNAPNWARIGLTILLILGSVAVTYLDFKIKPLETHLRNVEKDIAANQNELKLVQNSVLSNRSLIRDNDKRIDLLSKDIKIMEHNIYNRYRLSKNENKIMPTR